MTSIDDDPMESAPTFPVTDSLSGSEGDAVLDKTNGVVKSSGHIASQEDAEGELGHPPGSMVSSRRILCQHLFVCTHALFLDLSNYFYLACLKIYFYASKEFLKNIIISVNQTF